MKPDSYVLKSDKKNLSPRALALLSSNANSFGSSVMAKAAAELKEKQEKEDAEKALAYLKNFDSILQTQVAKLKSIREEEAAQRKIVKVVDAAFEKFAEDGDAVAFKKAVNAVGIY